LDKFDNSTILIQYENKFYKEDMFYKETKRKQETYLEMFPYHSRTLEVILSLFFLMHSFTLTSITFNSIIDCTEILLEDFRGLLIYTFKMS